MRRRTASTISLAVALAAGTVLMSGCWSRIQLVDQSSSGSSATTSATSGAATPTADIKPMTIQQKQQLIAPTFQMEVPVPFGDVVRGEAQGPEAWDYEVIVKAPVAAVAEWYQSAYVGREWKLADQSSPSADSVQLTFTKNAAQTQVTIEPVSGDATHSRVKGILGVGAPVLQTQ